MYVCMLVCMYACFHEIMTQTVAASFLSQFNKQCDLLGINAWCKSDVYIYFVCICIYVRMQNSLTISGVDQNWWMQVTSLVYVCMDVYMHVCVVLYKVNLCPYRMSMCKLVLGGMSTLEYNSIFIFILAEENKYIHILHRFLCILMLMRSFVPMILGYKNIHILCMCLHIHALMVTCVPMSVLQLVDSYACIKSHEKDMHLYIQHAYTYIYIHTYGQGCVPMSVLQLVESDVCF
jgi:hypothetical protein